MTAINKATGTAVSLVLAGLLVVAPGLPPLRASAAPVCADSQCMARESAQWRAKNPKLATFLDVFNWIAFAISMSPAGPVRPATFNNAFRGVGLSRGTLPSGISPVSTTFASLESTSTQAYRQLSVAVDLIEETIADPGLDPADAQHLVDLAQQHDLDLAADLQQVYDGTRTSAELADWINTEVQSAADGFLNAANEVSNTYAEGDVPSDAVIRSFDGVGTAMTAGSAAESNWQGFWQNPAADLGADKGVLGPKNVGIAKLLDPNSGKIGTVAGGPAKYQQMVKDFTDSLKSPSRTAADAMARFDRLEAAFSAPNRQGVTMTYLPKANLDVARETIAAKRMYEAGIADLQPGGTVASGLTPDYVALDQSFVGDCVRMSGPKSADAFKAGVKAKIGEKLKVYAARTGQPVRVVIDASDSPAVTGASLGDFADLAAAGVRMVSPQDAATIKDVVVLGPGGMLVQTDSAGRIVLSTQQ
ncbi:hypothetical protein P3T36_001021 [Kitasatospora sp. MAP12-15]|uniref:hypothetical protein n=1 Tax=unclassified Kitasatospora TaxID=2633591 RepID=UPI0024743519|nr:hypothetical protein [Kitasatospora sp. MAP12-44]MDH6114669.1 hypothetical protein [Kitasatospora sp. MAP12-44]